MKSVKGVLGFLLILVLFSPAFSQQQRRPAPRVRHQRYEARRDDIRERQDADAEAARAATLEKSEQAQETYQRAVPVTGQTTYTTRVQMHQRLVLINSQLTKLQNEKKAALEAAKPADEVAALDEQIKSLEEEAAGLKASLGLPTQ